MIKIYLMNMVIIFENELLSNNVNIIERSDVVRIMSSARRIGSVGPAKIGNI